MAQAIDHASTVCAPGLHGTTARTTGDDQQPNDEEAADRLETTATAFSSS
ncbi:MAG: hypothetical protein QOE61_895 [Micromonosporaceae bacterium]|jgi:hypothetical protein|nr:hypothetical protein [Micromonosporaceae bacterium]